MAYNHFLRVSLVSKRQSDMVKGTAPGPGDEHSYPGIDTSQIWIWARPFSSVHLCLSDLKKKSRWLD